MEEAAADGLSRPPDDRDIATLARELNRLGARYLVIGGVAINRLGFVRATDDLDLLISRDLANQRLVRRALEILPDKAVRELEDHEDLKAEDGNKRQLSERPAKKRLVRDDSPYLWSERTLQLKLQT